MKCNIENLTVIFSKFIATSILLRVYFIEWCVGCAFRHGIFASTAHRDDECYFQAATWPPLAHDNASPTRCLTYYWYNACLAHVKLTRYSKCCGPSQSICHLDESLQWMRYGKLSPPGELLFAPPRSLLRASLILFCLASFRSAVAVVAATLPTTLSPDVGVLLSHSRSLSRDTSRIGGTEFLLLTLVLYFYICIHRRVAFTYIQGVPYSSSQFLW